MPESELFEKGLIFFNAGRYYEAHEVWEDLWRIVEGSGKSFYQGLIQAAVGLHHLERGNQAGARSQLWKSIQHLSNSTAVHQDIDTPGLILQLQEIHETMKLRAVRIVRLN